MDPCPQRTPNRRDTSNTHRKRAMLWQTGVVSLPIVQRWSSSSLNSSTQMTTYWETLDTVQHSSGKSVNIDNSRTYRPTQHATQFGIQLFFNSRYHLLAGESRGEVLDYSFNGGNCVLLRSNDRRSTFRVPANLEAVSFQVIGEADHGYRQHISRGYSRAILWVSVRVLTSSQIQLI